MSKFGDVKQKDRLFSSVSSKAFLQAAFSLPDPNGSDDGLFVQTMPMSDVQDTILSGKIYTKRTVGSQISWKPVDVSKFGAPSAPMFQTKRITQDVIFLRWRSGKDDNGDWAYDVIVRKLNGTPSGPDDGEIVGYSDIRDQYAHPVDASGKIDVPNWMIDDELNKGFIVPVTDTTLPYTYRIFSVSTSGGFSSSDPIPGYWTYPDIKQTVVNKLHRFSFKLGDTLALPNNKLVDGVGLHAQIVAFNYRYSNSDTPENITFMMREAIVDETFDDVTNVYRISRMRALAEQVAKAFGDEFYRLIGSVPVSTMTRDFNAFSDTVNSKMWIPSFMEIYGRYPIGANNSAYSDENHDTAVIDMWKRLNPNSGIDPETGTPYYRPDIEGQQFDLFKKLSGDELYEARKRYTLAGNTCQWYLRTMSLFVKENVPLEVFYVPHETSATTKIDVAKAVNSQTSNPTTQPVFCFRIDDTVS